MAGGQVRLREPARGLAGQQACPAEQLPGVQDGHLTVPGEHGGGLQARIGTEDGQAFDQLHGAALPQPQAGADRLPQRDRADLRHPADLAGHRRHARTLQPPAHLEQHQRVAAGELMARGGELNVYRLGEHGRHQRLAALPTQRRQADLAVVWQRL